MTILMESENTENSKKIEEKLEDTNRELEENDKRWT